MVNPMDSMIGRKISHYNILERLGAGGMGVVYKALDMKLDRFVAVKFLPPHLGGDEKARRRLIAEAKAASALDHLNIGTIHEIDENADIGLFIVMAYYPGESLAQRLRKGPLPIALSVDFAIQTGEGLARAHDHKIVHRDIKPGNLLVTDEGIVKILDFGLAKAQNMESTAAGVCLGTPAYMSPERVTNEPIDHRCDIWALGVVLYTMITARLPFECDDIWEMLDRIRGSDPAPFKAPAELRTIILKALSKRPSARHQTMKDLVAELRELQQKGSAFPELGISEDSRASEPIAQQTARSSRLRSLASGELRQLTVLSCELVDWPALGEQLDSEQLGEVLAGYQTVCESAIQPFEGHVAQSLEAELNIHFGYPQAHEDDALRAVAAGLTIAAGIRRMNAERRRSIPSLRQSPLKYGSGSTPDRQSRVM